MKEIEVDELFAKNVSHSNEINPYIGCSHNCAYCYVPVKLNYDYPCKTIYVKKNLLFLLKKYLREEKAPGYIFFSSLTDPYQPLEKKYRIVRSCLEIIKDYPIQVDILTKSNLIVRDIDILSKIKCKIMISICVFDEVLRKHIEIGAPSIEKRLAALKIFRENNIPCGVRLKPILPFFLTDYRKIIEAVGPLITSRIVVQGFIEGNNPKSRLENVIKTHFPERYKDWHSNKKMRKRYIKEMKSFLRTHPLIDLQEI